MRDGAGPPQPPQAADDDLSMTPLDAPDSALGHATGSPLAARRGVRARVATVGATALLVVVVAVSLFAHATSDPAGAVATLLGLPTPTPAATLVPGVNLIYASNGAPWGTLTIDGRRMPARDMLGNGFTVSRGAHHLDYQARYFPTLRCVFSVPPAASDTCPLDSSTSANQFLLMHGHGRVLDLGSTGLTLQSDQRDALTRLADSILAAQRVTVNIAPGERYLDDQGRVVTATQPLRFTLTLALDAEQGSGAGTYCAQFCPIPSFSAGGLLDHSQWSTSVTVASSWAITDASGRRITGPAYQAGQPYPGAEPVTVGIQLTPTGWAISGLEQQSAAALINAAMATLGEAVSAAGRGGGYGSSVALGQNPLEGCVLVVEFDGNDARLLWRFGVLFALGSDAHHYFPQLPVATTAEQAAANSIRQP